MIRLIQSIFTIVLFAISSTSAFACENHQNLTLAAAQETGANIEAQEAVAKDSTGKAELKKAANISETTDTKAISNTNKLSESDTQESISEASKENPQISSQQAASQETSEANVNEGNTQASAQTTQATQNETTADLEAIDFVLTSQVESREPKDSVESFAGQERGFAFARLHVKNSGDVTFIWTRDGNEYARSTMPVQIAKKWRTYSSVKLRPGNWKVQLVSNNQVIAEKTFTVE